MGRVTKKIEVDISSVPNDQYSMYFSPKKEQFHHTLGAGFRIVMNENFVAAADYGIPLDSRDGKSGIYIGMNFLF